MTKERAEKVFDDAGRPGQEVRANREKFVQELVDSAQKARADLSEMMREQVRNALAGLDIATKQDIARVEAKVDEMAKGARLSLDDRKKVHVFPRRFGLSRRVEHLRRYRHIAAVLVKYGLEELGGGLKQRLGGRSKLGRPQRLRLALEELGPTFVKLGRTS